MYQERFGESRSQAEGRAGFLGVLILVSLGLVVLAFIILPYQETRTEKIQLLPGNHTWAKELPTHEFPPVLITYERDFLRLADGKETDVSIDVYIIYQVVEEGQPFQYRQYHNTSLFLKSYEDGVENPEIHDGILTRTLHRDLFLMKGMGIVLALLAMFWAGPLRGMFIPPPPRPLEA